MNIPVSIITRVMANNIAIARTKYGVDTAAMLGTGYSSLIRQVVDHTPDLTWHMAIAYLHGYIEYIATTEKSVPEDYVLPEYVAQAFDDYLIRAELEMIPEDQIQDDLVEMGKRYFA